LLVKQNAKTITDNLDGLFVTSDLNKKRITIHYFESSFDYDDRLIQSSYNVFDLSEDFMQMLILSEELLPHEQPKNIKRIKTIKAPTEKLVHETYNEKAIAELAEALHVDLENLNDPDALAAF
jgi:hypothetical protein